MLHRAASLSGRPTGVTNTQLVAVKDTAKSFSISDSETSALKFYHRITGFLDFVHRLVF
jgi:hypothetical protein